MRVAGVTRKALLHPTLGLLAMVAGAAGCARVPPATSTAAGGDMTSELAPGEVTVFAASSLTDAFGEIGSAFEQAHPGVTVVFNFAGSPTLRTQIEEGAAADVFASANAAEMEALIASGSVDPDVRDFAGNRLAVITAPGSDPPIRNLEDLARPGVKIVLAAEEVPVGRYSRQALASLNDAYGTTYADEVLANVVSLEENARLVVAKVALGEADAAIVYATDAAIKPALGTIAIEDSHNVLATYPLAVLIGAARPDLGLAFVDFVLSPEGQAILGSFGFEPPEGE